MNTKAEAKVLNKPNRNSVDLLLKRAFDVTFSFFILSLIWPVMLLIAIGIKATSKGPIIFKQKRCGLGGNTFYIYKFRSMKVHEENSGRVTQATKGDSRITAIGGFIRKTSLDELPQFINVLKGDMAVVGPRPHALEHDQYYSQYISNYMKRNAVKPGLTGWAQINGSRGETETIEKMECRINYDLWYVNNWTPFLDVKIVAITPFKILSKNAY